MPVSSIAYRLSMAQASSGMATGIMTPFFGVWLAWRGLSAGQITMVLSAGLLLRIVAGPLVGIVADARNDRRSVMLWLYWAIVVGCVILSITAFERALAPTAIAVIVATGVVLPLLESISVRLADFHGFPYGRIRLWASSAFIAFNVIGGVCLWRFGPGAIAPLLAATAFFCVVSTLWLPSPAPHRPHCDFTLGLRKTFREACELLRHPSFLILLVTGSLTQGSHAFYYNFGGLHWHALGYSGVMIGLIWPVGVFAEITILAFAHRIVKVLGPARLLFWGAATCAVRWTVMAFDPPLAVVVATQFLHGITFALPHLGVMFFILRAVPPRLAATAQSLYFVCYTGLALGTATYVSGLIYAAHGGLAYLLMSAMGLGAMACAYRLGRRWSGGRILQSAGTDSIDTI
jgi:MFS transporter, PPP family, 3-phenylpropionic acid transporter